MRTTFAILSSVHTSVLMSDDWIISWLQRSFYTPSLALSKSQVRSLDNNAVLFSIFNVGLKEFLGPFICVCMFFSFLVYSTMGGCYEFTVHPHCACGDCMSSLWHTAFFNESKDKLSILCVRMCVWVFAPWWIGILCRVKSTLCPASEVGYLTGIRGWRMDAFSLPL